MTLISRDQNLEGGIFWPVAAECSSVRGKLMGIVLVTRVSFSFWRKILTLRYVPRDVAQRKWSDTFYFLHNFILACSRKNMVVGNPSPVIFF